MTFACVCVCVYVCAFTCTCQGENVCLRGCVRVYVPVRACALVGACVRPFVVSKVFETINHELLLAKLHGFWEELLHVVPPGSILVHCCLIFILMTYFTFSITQMLQMILIRMLVILT